MPFSFSQHSKNQRATLHPDLQIICDTLLKFHDFKIETGHRGEAEQNAAFSAKRSKLKFPNSKHNSNPSMAMDLLPFVNGTFIGWTELSQWRFFAGYVMGVAVSLYDSGAITHRLRWGGDWSGDNDLSDNTFNDLPHFELWLPK
jgi:peptidoglycan L-alanyl-D-glutamate endopeptidase CwlK